MDQYFDLFQRCKKGDAKAQRILYDVFKSKLLGICRRYTGSREEAKDILQDTFIKIFSKIHQVEAVEKLEAWMYSIAVRTAIDFYHRKKADQMVFAQLDVTEMDAVADVSIKDLTDEYLINLINQLPTGCRLVFNLFVVEGYGHNEIAEMLTITEGTSRSQLHYAKYLLKQKFKSLMNINRYEKFA
jgi:RNA polymerase sigma factor (sigma-70 family)